MENQEKLDRLWNKHTAEGGEESMCGWLKDKFGLSWQIVPTMFEKLWSEANSEQTERVMSALL